MERTTIQVGTFEVNCTILSENGKAWIVDPGNEASRILDLLAKVKLAPAAVLLTHAHFDHIGAVPSLQKTFAGLPVYVGNADRAVVCHPMNQLPPEYPAIKDVKDIRDAKDLKAEQDLEVEVIETPGHTPGGVCYYFENEKLLLSGDTLFAGSVGRTDLPGGDMATLMSSLQKLAALPDDTTVVPGHGMFTTIGGEKHGNPFLQ